tara:strand:+ start:596 stop:802 length:207 start_codon:yes stop_codon:yes gene_type:complete
LWDIFKKTTKYHLFFEKLEKEKIVAIRTKSFFKNYPKKEQILLNTNTIAPYDYNPKLFTTILQHCPKL